MDCPNDDIKVYPYSAEYQMYYFSATTSYDINLGVSFHAIATQSNSDLIKIFENDFN